MQRPISEALVADHDRIRARLARAIEGDRESYEELRGALLRHIGIEEKVILPALRAVGCEPPMAAQLRLDHAALAAMLVPTPTPELLRRLATLLDQHDPLEEDEDGLYPLADARIPAPAEVLQRIERAPVPPLAPHFDGPRAHASLAALLARAAAGRAGR